MERRISVKMFPGFRTPNSAWKTFGPRLKGVCGRRNRGLFCLTGYRYGYGVAKDFVLAHMWYNLAAAQGNFGSGWERGVVAMKMTPAQISEAQKLAREWKPKK